MSIDDTLHGLASRYQAAPQWLKLTVGGLYGAIPERYRHGQSYRRFLGVFSSTDVSQDYLDQRLRQTIAEAIAGVPVYSDYRRLLKDHDADPRSLLGQLPLTSKEDIKRRLVDHVNSSYPESARLRMFTGGSTSIPMTFYVQKGVSRAKEWAAFHAMGTRFGTEGRGIVLALRGRTVSTAGSGRVWAYEPIKRHLVVSSDHLEPRFMPEYVSALRRWRPRHIHAFASALFPLLLWLRENGHAGLLSSVESVVLTSESVFEHHMKAFQAFFDCPVMVTYGHSERVLLANTLPSDTRYHFWPQYGHLELIGADGQPIRNAGEVGEIVGTSFDNHVMPFVRYRTGDYAVLGGAPHPSATGFQVLERIEGRLQEFVVCKDHRLVTVTTLGAAHFEQLDRCLRIQYEQSVPGELLMRVVALEPLTEVVRRQIETAVSHKTQGGCRIQMQEVDQIATTQTGKQRLLIQNLDISQYLGSAMDRSR